MIVVYTANEEMGEQSEFADGTRQPGSFSYRCDLVVYDLDETSGTHTLLGWSKFGVSLALKGLTTAKLAVLLDKRIAEVKASWEGAAAVNIEALKQGRTLPAGVPHPISTEATVKALDAPIRGNIP